MIRVAMMLLMGIPTAFAEWNFEINAPSKLSTQNIKEQDVSFTKIIPDFKNFQLSKKRGKPELPVKSFLVAAKAEAISVQIEKDLGGQIDNFYPYPAQKEKCRCPEDEKYKFSYDPQSYQQRTNSVQVKYLGSYRGQDVSQVVIPLAHFDYKNKRLQLFSKVRVSINQNQFLLPKRENKKYLIVGNPQLIDASQEFIQWKQDHGYQVFTANVSSVANTKNMVKDIIQDYYDREKISFVLLLGDELGLPMYQRYTAGGETPSDLDYFLLEPENPDDYIPDVYYGRIPFNDSEQVSLSLQKSIQFEAAAQFEKRQSASIGIASNEGSAPSDDEYVRNILLQFEKMGFPASYFYQDDPLSNPEQLNTRFNAGANWMIYMGHGSGQSWTSMYSSYSVNNISGIDNENQNKPIIIDVACQNGRLLDGYLGTSIFKKWNTSFGVTAFFGGTVNISWHPPAIMATGIATNHVENNFEHLGEAIFSGQFYLAENYESTEAIIDNWEWYHLQGDPSLNIQY
jgi:hypothetical protein